MRAAPGGSSRLCRTKHEGPEREIVDGCSGQEDAVTHCDCRDSPSISRQSAECIGSTQSCAVYFAASNTVPIRAGTLQSWTGLVDGDGV